MGSVPEDSKKPKDPEPDNKAVPAQPRDGNTNDLSIVAKPEFQDERPQIDASPTRSQGDVVDELNPLLSEIPDLFSRGRVLGKISSGNNQLFKPSLGFGLGFGSSAQTFHLLSPSNLGVSISRVARFVREVRTRSGGTRYNPVYPPRWLVSAIHELGEWYTVRPLISLTTAPYVEIDGRLTKPGYNAKIAAYFKQVTPIRDWVPNPAQDDAVAAAKNIRELVSFFPFPSEADFAAWLATLLTAIQRPMIAGPVPGLVLNGNSAGTGKGLLVDVICMIAYGYLFGTRPYPSDQAEFAKSKLALALACLPLVHFDNKQNGSYVGGSVEDSLITSRFVADRILGASQDSGNIPWRSICVVTGNNLSFKDDSDRRWMLANLVSDHEKPHERDDLPKGNLIEVVSQKRSDLLRNCLTILAAHALADRPRGLVDGKSWPLLGSFEDWDQAIRGAVWFATGQDCLETQRTGATESPKKIDSLKWIEGLGTLDPDGHGKTYLEIHQAGLDGFSNNRSLHEAVNDLAIPGRSPAAKDVRMKLRELKNVVVDGMRIVAKGENRLHQMLWSVERVSGI